MEREIQCRARLTSLGHSESVKDGAIDDELSSRLTLHVPIVQG